MLKNKHVQNNLNVTQLLNYGNSCRVFPIEKTNGNLINTEVSV